MPPKEQVLNNSNVIASTEGATSNIQASSMAPAVLPGVFKIIGEAWNLYTHRIKTIIGIMLIPLLFTLALSQLSTLQKFYSSQFDGPNKILIGLVFLVVILIVSIVSTIFQLSAQIALWYSIKDGQEGFGVIGSYRKAFSIFFSYLWVLILVGCIVVGGFLLFIIPGIIFMTSFGFAIIVLISENERGMNALLKSREYVRGMWWAIFGRAFLSGLIISLPFYAILGALYIFKIPYIQIISSVISFLFLLPLTFSIMFLLYQHVRSIKGNIIVDTSASKKAPFVILGLLTPVFIIGTFVLVSTFGFLAATTRGKMAAQNNSISQTVATSTAGMELTTYTNDEFGYSLAYPKTWDKEVQAEGNSTSVIFLEPDQGKGLLRTTVQVTAVHLPVPQNIETTTNNYKQALESNKVTTDGQDTLLEDSPIIFMGFPAHEFISTKLRSFDDGKTYIKRKQRSILFTKGTTLFNVEYKKDIDFFDLMEPLADSIIANLVINKGN